MKYLLALLLLSANAHALVVYDWTGDCSAGCTGQAHATFTFGAYTPGALPPMISLEYSDSSGSVFIPHPFIDGGNNSKLPEATGIGVFFWTMAWPSFWFIEDIAGHWNNKFEGEADFGTPFDPHPPIILVPGIFSSGSNGVFALRTLAIPEPGTLLLVMVGLVGLGAVNIRRRLGAKV